jgi:hypothetical protein
MRLTRIGTTLAIIFGTLLASAPAMAEQVYPDKYRDEFVDEYWAAWQRRVAREGKGIGGDRA